VLPAAKLELAQERADVLNEIFKAAVVLLALAAASDPRTGHALLSFNPRAIAVRRV